jgi:REP element-mobilizing transposase RayT
MAFDEPLAYFITWTVYGTHLQGAATGWRKYKRGMLPSQPLLESWHKSRLKYPVLQLNPTNRLLVERAIDEHCRVRQWRLWRVSARSNHVHVVVTATGVSGAVVRDQLKANSTRLLRERDSAFCDRPTWSRGGDWQCLNSEDDLQTAVAYVRDAQDRKDPETAR